MGRILQAYIMPHPPVLIPEIGKNRIHSIQQSLDSARAIAKQIARQKPDVLILSSPHAPCLRDFFHIAGDAVLDGDFSGFGHPEIKLSFQADLPLAQSIARIATMQSLAAAVDETSSVDYHLRQPLDHGAMVPLYFIAHEVPGIRLVLLSTPFTDNRNLYRFGQCIARAVRASGENAVYIASGDLSHGLLADAPAGFCESGEAYDRNLVEIIRENAADRLLALTEASMAAAAECGTRSIIMMYGALSGLELSPQIYSYEGPFGVGYLTASIDVVESAPVRLARSALEDWVCHQRILTLPNWLPEDLKQRKAGAFVSIKKQGSLRGCIGTITASQTHLADEIVRNARLAASEDPRFPPVQVDELPDLEINVDVLGPAESIQSAMQLDVEQYGVIVRSCWRCGLLLPALEGVDTPKQQIAIALKKAGIVEGEPYQLERFEVKRYY